MTTWSKLISNWCHKKLRYVWCFNFAEVEPHSGHKVTQPSNNVHGNCVRSQNKACILEVTGLFSSHCLAEPKSTLLRFFLGFVSKRCHNSFLERDLSQTAPFCTKISGKQVLVSTFARKPSPTMTELEFAVFQLVYVRGFCQAERRECWKNWSVAGGGGRAQLRLRVAYSCPSEP